MAVSPILGRSSPDLPFERYFRLGRTGWIIIFLVALIAAAGWAAFQPWTANHFGYALPIKNGLPCRLQYSGRAYENLEQCGGTERTAWMVWYEARHPGPSGGACQTPAELRRELSWPLREVQQIFTLLGPSHDVLVVKGVPAGMTSTVIFVRDGPCFRPYELLGGP
jgi:hypothetical protein